MEKDSDILLEKDYTKGDLGSIGIGAALGGPFGALLGLGANRLYKWGRGKYLQKKAKKAAEKQKQSDDKNSNNDNQNKEPEDLQQKIQKAQDSIRNAGMFEPEVYKNHQFYKTTIYDSLNPEENNFVFISNGRNGGKAYEQFLEYWKEKYAQKVNSKSKMKTAPSEIENFKKMVRERFKRELNVPCLITVPQTYLINDYSVLGMAKNSDIMAKEKNIYYDKPSFDSNYAFDIHMYQNKNEAIENDDIDDYKISLIWYEVYGRNYTYAFDLNGKDINAVVENLMLNLGQELAGDDVDKGSRPGVDNKLYAFSKTIEKMIYTEKKKTNVYCVATPLLRKNSTTPQDLEYNAALLDGIGIYTSEEEFKQNYLEDYQKLLENQMGL